MTLSPQQSIETSTGRWNSETTLDQRRAYRDGERTRRWCRNTLLPAEPCWFGLSTVVALAYQGLVAANRQGTGGPARA